MTEQEAMEVLSDFDKQVSAKADGAYQSTIGEMACKVAIKALEEIQQYRAIGTVKECREAAKKLKLKRPLYDKENRVLKCPNCKSYLQTVIHEDGFTEGPMPRYCKSCGQKINPYWNAGK